MVDGENFTVHPLKVKDMPLLMAASSKDTGKQAEALAKILKKTLKQSVPDATDEELDNISMKYFNQFTDAIMKVNGLEDVSQKKNPKPE